MPRSKKKYILNRHAFTAVVRCLSSGFVACLCINYYLIGGSLYVTVQTYNSPVSKEDTTVKPVEAKDISENYFSSDRVQCLKKDPKG